MNPDGATLRKDLLDQALLYSARDYDFANSTYAALDSKAQATFGLAGVFLAGTVALLTTIGGPDAGSAFSRAMIVLTYVLLLAAIVFSVISLRVRETDAPLRAGAVSKMTLEFVDVPDEELTQETRTNWYREQLRVWERAADSVDAANRVKAMWLTAAQVMLLIAIVCAGVATLSYSLR